MTGEMIMHANTTRWGEIRHPVNSKKEFYFIGTMSHDNNIEAMSEQGTGATRFYCIKHNCIFKINAQCEMCQAEAVKVGPKPELETPVTPL